MDYIFQFLAFWLSAGFTQWGALSRGQVRTSDVGDNDVSLVLIILALLDAGEVLTVNCVCL